MQRRLALWDSLHKPEACGAQKPRSKWTSFKTNSLGVRAWPDPTVEDDYRPFSPGYRIVRQGPKNYFCSSGCVLAALLGLSETLRFFESEAYLVAENLFLTKQLTFYQERNSKPRRLTDSARFALTDSETGVLAPAINFAATRAQSER